jgi:thymidylate synthase ThyX
MAFEAEIFADSISPDEIRLTTFQITFPRFILAEVNTHRMLSRNSASSRAIPVKKAIKMVEEDPFIPEEFGQNKAGMSWDASLDEVKSKRSRLVWEDAMKEAIYAAGVLDEMEVHKALANRILEPFKWHTAIITATEWSNFFGLRTDANAQPEFRKIALMMQELMQYSEPVVLQPGQWHLPLVQYHEMVNEAKLPTDCTGPISIDWEFWKKIAVGRCARVSYLTHDGKRELDKDVQLHDQLRTNGHLSPFEHIATPCEPYWNEANKLVPDMKFYGNFRGWWQYRKEVAWESDFSKLKEQVAA